MLFGTETAELAVLHFIQNTLGCDFLDFFMPKLTVLGNGGILWIAVGIFLLCTKKYRPNGIFLLTVLLVGFILGNVVLKNLIARPRPCWLDQSITLLISNPKDFSFPSGHTWSSFASSFVLFKAKKSFGCTAFFIASIIAFSRMYLFVHFPTDILGGIILGYGVYILVEIFLIKIRVPLFKD